MDDSLRDAQIEAARKVLGWELEPMGEYADSAMDVLGQVVDAVMAVLNGAVEDAMVAGRHVAGAVARDLAGLRDGDLFALPGGAVLRTHPASACEGQACVIHHPSDHPMRGFPLCWRPDRSLMERTCPCGVGHPDPDDLAHKLRTRGDGAQWESIHGCCPQRCCTAVAA